MARLLFGSMLVCLCGIALCADQSGFTGPVVLQLMDEIELDHKFRLLEDFSFRDGAGKVWLARKDGILDGATVPRNLQTLDGLPFVVEYRKASVLHDFHVATRSEPWRDVDRMLYDASLTEGLAETEAKVLYMAVYAGGWRWEMKGSSCFRSCHAAAAALAWRPVVQTDDVQPLVDWIRQANPTLADIDRRVDATVKKPGPHLFAQGY